MPHLDTVVKEITDEMAQQPDRGSVATYIPELARVDPKAFGLAVIDHEGNVLSLTSLLKGDGDPKSFTINLQRSEAIELRTEWTPQYR